MLLLLKQCLGVPSNEIETLSHVLGTCVQSDGSNRRFDTIAFSNTSRTSFIIDLTVRFEIAVDPSILVNKEKKRIHELSIPEIKLKLKSIEVIGLGERNFDNIFHGLC